MQLSASRIAELLPHAGRMCLIDRVSFWDRSMVACSAESHREPENPLRFGDALAGIHAFEYGAQAAAIHGGLVAESMGADFRPGYLAALRDAELFVSRLDTITGPLEIKATLLGSDERLASYRSVVTSGGADVAKARLAVILW